jgi:hypothetical protein
MPLSWSPMSEINAVEIQPLEYGHPKGWVILMTAPKMMKFSLSLTLYQKTLLTLSSKDIDIPPATFFTKGYQLWATSMTVITSTSCI